MKKLRLIEAIILSLFLLLVLLGVVSHSQFSFDSTYKENLLSSSSVINAEFNDKVRKYSGVLDLENKDANYLFITFRNAYVELYIDGNLRASYTGSSNHKTDERISSRNMIVEKVSKEDSGKNFELYVKNSSIFFSGDVQKVRLARLSDILLSLKSAILAFLISIIAYISLILITFVILLFFRKASSIGIILRFMALCFITMVLSFSSNIGNFIVINSYNFWNIARLFGFTLLPVLSRKILVLDISSNKPRKLWFLIPAILALIAIILSYLGSSLAQSICSLVEIYSLCYLIIITLVPVLPSGSKKLGFKLFRYAGLLYSTSLVIYFVSVTLYNNIHWAYNIFDLLLITSLLIISSSSVSLFLKAKQSLLKDDDLQVLSYIDYLSSCLNRRCFEDDISNFWLTVNQDLFVIVIDINEMKAVNDAYGHEAGDSLIVHTSCQMSSLLSHRARMYRIGGDEFVIIVPTLNRDEKTIANAVKTLYAENAPYNSTISVGVAKSSTNSTLRDTFKLADQRMYQDKRQRYESR